MGADAKARYQPYCAEVCASLEAACEDAVECVNVTKMHHVNLRRMRQEVKTDATRWRSVRRLELVDEAANKWRVINDDFRPVRSGGDKVCGLDDTADTLPQDLLQLIRQCPRLLARSLGLQSSRRHRIPNPGFRPRKIERDARSAALVEQLLSPAVQVLLAQDIDDVPVEMTEDEVQEFILQQVPGVESFVYREQEGAFVLVYLVDCYFNGIKAFRESILNHRLIKLFRLVVHHGRDNGPKSAVHLKEIAEAFQNCQAVQARTVEKVALQILGVTRDFKGAVARLVGEYKAVAVKMLALEHIEMYDILEDDDPIHYEHRLVVDLGNALGLDSADIRRAALDEHARRRHAVLNQQEKEKAVVRARQLFDVEACLKAFLAEVSSPHEHSDQTSLPALFLEWASEHLGEHRHVVLDEETCTTIQIDNDFARAVLEDLFCGGIRARDDELCRGRPLLQIFGDRRAPAVEPTQPAESECADGMDEPTGSADCATSVLRRRRWEWCTAGVGPTAVFEAYSDETTQLLEDACVDGVDVVDVSKNHHVNLSNMRQEIKSDATRWRHVRRMECMDEASQAWRAIDLAGRPAKDSRGMAHRLQQQLVRLLPQLLKCQDRGTAKSEGQGGAPGCCAARKSTPHPCNRRTLVRA